MIDKYRKEFVYLRLYIFIILIAIVASYSVYLFFDIDTVAYLGLEDHFFEWATAISLFSGSMIFLILFFKSKNIFMLLLFIALFFGAGEEISWGQRIIGFKTPDSMKHENIQGEFNIHNLDIFNNIDDKGVKKTGLMRIFEINFLFRIFTIVFGILLPILVYHLKFFSYLSLKLRVPIPPLAIGFLFFINWIVFWILHRFFISIDQGKFYYAAAGEIFECLSAFILFLISLYFYIDRKKITFGEDIKCYL